MFKCKSDKKPDDIANEMLDDYNKIINHKNVKDSEQTRKNTKHWVLTKAFNQYGRCSELLRDAMNKFGLMIKKNDDE